MTEFKKTQAYLNLKRIIKRGDLNDQRRVNADLLEFIAILMERVDLNERRLITTKNYINDYLVTYLNGEIAGKAMEEVTQYCENDVKATEEAFNAIQEGVKNGEKDS